MREDFKNFISDIRLGVAIGEIKITKELSDFDLAVTFAVGKIGERKGYPCNVTLDEIENEINNFAPELLESEDAE